MSLIAKHTPNVSSLRDSPETVTFRVLNGLNGLRIAPIRDSICVGEGPRRKFMVNDCHQTVTYLHIANQSSEVFRFKHISRVSGGRNGTVWEALWISWHRKSSDRSSS